MDRRLILTVALSVVTCAFGAIFLANLLLSTTGVLATLVNLSNPRSTESQVLLAIAKWPWQATAGIAVLGIVGLVYSIVSQTNHPMSQTRPPAALRTLGNEGRKLAKQMGEFVTKCGFDPDGHPYGEIKDAMPAEELR